MTTDDRSTFADGLDTGGDVTANWTVLNPVSFTAANGATLAKLGDHSLLVSGAPNTIVAHTTLTGITGFRLEALLDPSLAHDGPGFACGGSFVVQEFQVSIAPVPEPASTVLLSGLGLLGLAACRKCLGRRS